MIKRKSINRILAAAFAFLMMFNTLLGQELISPFNKLPISDSSQDYSFIVSGHFHGASTNASTFPASTLLANIDTLNSLKPAFMMSLGDMFLDVNDSYLSHYQKTLFSKLKMPLFNAVGNHDIANGNIYEKKYGKSYFTFNKGSEIFVVLNTELNDGSIEGDQLTFLSEAIKGPGKNVFIFSHRPIWSENNEKYNKLFAGNTRSEFGKNNFNDVVLPLLKSAIGKKIFWISGSLGGGPASFFYDKDPESGITYMQTAIRDLPRDAVLQVKVENGNISFNGISLTGQNLQLIESYNVDFWKSTIAPEQKFNFRMLPFLTMQMIRHCYFWIGLFTGIFLVMVMTFIKKKRNKK